MDPFCNRSSFKMQICRLWREIIFLSSWIYIFLFHFANFFSWSRVNWKVTLNQISSLRREYLELPLIIESCGLPYLHGVISYLSCCYTISCNLIYFAQIFALFKSILCICNHCFIVITCIWLKKGIKSWQQKLWLFTNLWNLIIIPLQDHTKTYLLYLKISDFPTLGTCHWSYASSKVKLNRNVSFQKSSSASFVDNCKYVSTSKSYMSPFHNTQVFHFAI